MLLEIHPALQPNSSEDSQFKVGRVSSSVHVRATDREADTVGNKVSERAAKWETQLEIQWETKWETEREGRRQGHKVPRFLEPCA